MFKHASMGNGPARSSIRPDSIANFALQVARSMNVVYAKDKTEATRCYDRLMELLKKDVASHQAQGAAGMQIHLTNGSKIKFIVKGQEQHIRGLDLTSFFIADEAVAGGFAIEESILRPRLIAGGQVAQHLI